MPQRCSQVRRFVFGLVLAGWCVGSGVAQEAAPVPSPNLAGIAHVAIRVANLDASVAFYEKLGFVKAFALSREGKVYEAFLKINDRQYLELYPASGTDTQIGFLHVCFEGNDLHAAHDFYVAQGLTPKDVRTAGAGNLLFTMPGPATPTGPQNLEYTQYMPGSLHSKDFGQHLGAERIADKLVGVAIASDDPGAAREFYVQKMGFPGGKGALSLPGEGSESVEIVPDQPLGFKARITFAADPAKVAAVLAQRGIDFMKSRSGLVLTDPDGNMIALARAN
jgi:catechol 2,3-dioxygenase-like lactoylglutathione lyase family enzyme